MRCYHCGLKIDIQNKVGRQETCSQCGANLHCCLNCRFYDPNVYHQCQETEAEWVSDKNSANFCDYFESGVLKESKKVDKAEEARKKLDQLFKKKKSDSTN